MQRLLKEVADIPGVAGSCIYSKKDGTLCREGRRLAAEVLEQAGLHLLRLFQLGTMSGLKLKTVYFHFDSYAVVGMPFQTDSVFLAVCDPKTDCCVVAAKASLLTTDVPKPAGRCEPGSSAKAAEEEPSLPEPLDDSPDDLQAVFDRIEQALAGAIGPVAGMVLQDYIERWQQSGPAVISRIVDLTTLLVEEIGDPEAAQDFVAKVEDIC